MRKTTFGLLVLSVVCGCGNDSKCDSGQTEKEGLCVDEDSGTGGNSSKSSGAAGESTTDTGAAGQGTTEAQAGAPGAAPETGFGATCTTDDHCADPAPYCAKSPMDTEGYCTVTGCSADAKLCPDGWTCNTAYMTYGAPDFCAKE
jgi:hypothetical protein